MQNADPNSPQFFIRALKAPTDPPHPSGPLKIELARGLWTTPSFYVPDKGEVIVDWILTRLLKDKSKEPDVNPLLDFRYWDLLWVIISSPSPRPVKSRLLPILNRIPIAPALIKFLFLLPYCQQDVVQVLTDRVRQSLGIIWPLAVQKFSTETLLDAFTGVMGAVKSCEVNENLAQIGNFVLSSFRTSLTNANAGIKKKIYFTFVQKHLEGWLECTSGPTLGEKIFMTGIEIIFNLETMRFHQSPVPSSTTIFSYLALETSLPVLPRLFMSYLHGLKGHRNVLFSQGSDLIKAAEELKAAGMAFFTSCLALLDDSEAAWEVKDKLLVIVDQENIFGGYNDHGALKSNVEMAINALGAGGHKMSFANHVLSRLLRIDYELVALSVPRILHQFLFINVSCNSAGTFLDFLLDYHTKTRTIYTYILAVLRAFDLPAFSSYPSYQSASLSPICSARHTNRLEKAVHGFLTPAQTVEISKDILGTLRAAKAAFYEPDETEVDDGSGLKERTKSDLANGLAIGPQATSFILVAKFSTAILRSLPLHSLAESAREEVNGLVQDIVDLVKLRKSARGSSGGEEQTFCAACLRLEHALSIAWGLQSGPNLRDQPGEADGLLSLVYNIVKGELKLEIYCALLTQISTHKITTEATTVLDSLLSYIEDNLHQSTSWSGHLCHITSKEETALALFWMLVERWLPIINQVASSEQLDRVVRLFSGFSVSQDLDQKITWALCVTRALRTADMWELGSLRTAFLTHLNNTAPILNTKLGIDLTPAQHKAVCSAISTYELLLLVPVEYLSKACRVGLVTTAVRTDILLGSTPKEVERLVTVIRAFLSRVFSYLGHVDHKMIKEFLRHLMAPAIIPPSPSILYVSTTLDLIEVHFRYLLQSDSQGILEITQVFSPSISTSRRHICPIQSGSLMRLIDLLQKEFKPSAFSESIQSAMTCLHKQLSTILLDQLHSMDDNAMSSDLLLEWYHVLSFGRWLQLRNTPHKLGRRLLEKVLSSDTPVRTNPQFEDICIYTFAVLLEELHCLPDCKHVLHCDLTVAAYVSLSRTIGVNSQRKLDLQLSNKCKKLSVIDFSHILDLVLEFLSDRQTFSETDAACVIHLSALLLHEAPQGTLKQAQTFTSQMFNAFMGHPKFTLGALELRLQVLQFVARHCSERPAALRLLDLNCIWSLLAKFMSNSKNHDSETSTAMFAFIVNILNALIRLRRDLVVHALPHLGILLRQLITALRTLRPQLGGRQANLVMNTLPMWVNAISKPLGAVEARTLARLLSTLTTKSVVRIHTSETQKAESLAKPFSKHAAYVLKAYIEAMNDPLCVLPVELRKELEPGLFALCDMVNEHARDAMMVSALDAGGKVTLKLLWKEYEKQRYVGKG